jgi:hypothetical protein
MGGRPDNPAGRRVHVLAFAEGHHRLLALSGRHLDAIPSGGGPKPYFLLENGELVAMNIPVPRTIGGAATDFGLLQGILGYSHLIDWTMFAGRVTSWFELGISARVSTSAVLVVMRGCLRVSSARPPSRTWGCC